MQVKNQAWRLAGVLGLSGHIHPDEVAFAVLAPLVNARIDLLIHDALPARWFLARDIA